MYKAIAIVLTVLFLGTGCSTTGFLGLAKESYVKQLGEENEQLKEELDSIKRDMDKVLELADEIEDLEELTKDVKSKLDELPEETLRKIVLILQEYLDGKGGD